MCKRANAKEITKYIHQTPNIWVLSFAITRLLKKIEK